VGPTTFAETQSCRHTHQQAQLLQQHTLTGGHAARSCGGPTPGSEPIKGLMLTLDSPWIEPRSGSHSRVYGPDSETRNEQMLERMNE